MVHIYKGSYGTKWKNFRVDRYEGYKPVMSDYHMHEYYEISLVFSGRVKVLLPDSIHDGTESRILLFPPQAPHFITCESDILYKRVNLLFSHDFISEGNSEYKKLLGAFGKGGKVIPLTNDRLTRCSNMIDHFEKEDNEFRKRLILMYLLSELSEIVEGEPVFAPPAFILEALLYIQENFKKKIVAADLAWKLGVGRTTLMTEFKKHTGSTVNNFITDCRLKAAINLLNQGETQAAAALECGFGDACNMNRAFRRRFGMTPSTYIKFLL